MTVRLVGLVTGLAMAFCACKPADAAVVNSILGGTIIPIPGMNYQGFGPQIFGTPTITWSSQNVEAVFGHTGTFGFGSNGNWSGLSMASTDSASSLSMSFEFSSPVTAVGGLINYVPGISSATAPEIAVYGSSHNFLESFNPSFSTGGVPNSGFFYGFSEQTPIAYFELSGSFIGITDLTVSSAVPEPSTWAMLLLGFAGLGFAGYRRRPNGAFTVWKMARGIKFRRSPIGVNSCRNQALA